MNSYNSSRKRPWGLRCENWLSLTCDCSDAMVHTQAQITNFMSPPGVTGRTGTQSLPCGQVNPCRTSDAHPAAASGVSKEPELPQNKGKKSKKVRRAEKKATRKREKIARKKRDKSLPNSPANADCTPTNNPHNDTRMINDESESILLMDRSLRDMLASDDERSHDDSTSESVVSGQQRVIALESQLLAATIALEGERNEVSRLKCHVDLLEADYDAQKSELGTLKKTINKQKTDIKRFTRDNDSLRREISRLTGIRKFTDDACQNKLTNTTAEAVKFAEFRDKITHIAGSLIEALDCSEQGSDLTHVSDSRLISQNESPSNSARKCPKPSYKDAVLSRSPSASALTTDQRSAGMLNGSASHQCPSTTTPITNPPPSTPSQMGQPIPVVSLGVRRQQQTAVAAQVDVDHGDVTHTAPAPPHCHQEAAAHRRSQHRRVSSRGTVVIGTSLVKGLGQRLNKLGVAVTTYMYPGATLPVLQNRIKHILNCHDQPERIVLQCGGNDAEKQPAAVVSTRIESLVHDIRRISPKSDIMINKIPPRGRSRKVLNNIEKINSEIHNRYRNDDAVHIIDVCPKAIQCYRTDLVHFNSKGSYQFATHLAEKLSNFQWGGRKMWI